MGWIFKLVIADNLSGTTNSRKSFHSKLNGIFYSSNPNDFQFLEVLRNIQTNIYIKMGSSNLTNKRWTVMEKENFIKYIMTQLETKNVTR